MLLGTLYIDVAGGVDEAHRFYLINGKIKIEITEALEPFEKQRLIDKLERMLEDGREYENDRE